MCGRFTLHRPARAVADLFSLFTLPDLQPRYNIAPTQAVLSVRVDAQGTRVGLPLRWGLVPSWAEGIASGPPLLNARAETITEKPAFRTAIKQRRCLIPADGFYEWKQAGRERVPHYFHHATGELFAFAGLWELWERGGQVVQSVAVVTTQANELVRGVHDRMPVILPPDVHELWLDPAAQDVAQVCDLLVPFPADAMAVHPVGVAVGNVKYDHPTCIVPLVASQRLLFS